MFSTIVHRFRRERAARALMARARLESDPMSNPEFRGMSKAELADIAAAVGRR